MSLNDSGREMELAGEIETDSRYLGCLNGTVLRLYLLNLIN